MVDGDSSGGRIKVELLPFATTADERPHFVLSARKDNRWYEFFRERCRAMWEDSHPLDIESFDVDALKHLEAA